MNEILNQKKENFELFFVGVGGISMSALALYMKKIGFKVSGYDKNLSGITSDLERAGVTINGIRSEENCDIAVLSSAIGEDNEVYKKLKKLNKPIISRARLLWEIASAYSLIIGVCGTHGKTTCTSMLAHVLKCAQKSFCAHIGGLDLDFGNLAYFGNDIFLSEVCEYKKNLNLFSPTIGVLLNVSDDHLESYGRFSELENAFSDYLTRSKVQIVLHEQKKYADKSALTFSLKSKSATFSAGKIKTTRNGLETLVYEHGEPLFNLKLNSFYPHDVLNALACFCVGSALGIKREMIKCGIEDFKGVKRRSEIMGKIGNCLIFGDYAHHPDQIIQVVNLLKRKYKKFAIFFQSHTFSRTSNLFNKFVSSLKEVENLFIFDTFGAREKFDYKGSGKRLSENISNSIYCGEPKNAPSILGAISKKFDCVAVIGAGDLYDYVEKSLIK